MMSAPIIRKACPGEESAIHEAHMRSIREVCVKDHGEDEISGWGNRPLGNRWTDAIRDQSVWVIEMNGKIYGQGFIRIFSENDENKAHIHGLYLTPEVLGRGLGQQLAHLMIEAARKAGVKRITLESTLTAHEFYKRLGFADTGPMGRQEIAGHQVRYYPMALSL